MKYKFCMVYGPNKVILVAFYHTRNSCEASSIFCNITQDLRISGAGSGAVLYLLFEFLALSEI